MLPIIFSFGPVTIYSFAFLLAIGFFLAAFVIWRRLRDLGLDEEKIIDLIVLGAIFGLVPSKVFFFLSEGNLSGFSFWGGLLGTVIVLVWFTRKEKWEFWQITDEIVFGILPFAVLAQVGAFLDGSTPGKPTNLPWGIYFPGDLLRTQPVSLFSAIIFFLTWLFLLKIERQWRIWEWYRSKNSGLISLAFLGLAALGNFLVAFWHSAELYWHWLEIGASLAITILAGIILYHRSGRIFRDDLRMALRRESYGKEKRKKKT